MTEAQETNFATELLHEVKLQAKRWFIAFCIMVMLELLTIIGFMWYISLPTEDVSIENSDGNANYVGDNTKGVVITNGEDKSSAKSYEE